MKKLCAVVAVLCGFAALAETYTWQGADNGDWNVASNWLSSQSEPGVPSGTDTVVFDGTTGTITLNDAASIGGFTVRGTAKFTVSGTGSITLAAEKTVFDFANGSEATLDVELTGSGQLYKQGYHSYLYLTKDNTFTGGVEAKVGGSTTLQCNYIQVSTSRGLGVPDEGKRVVAHKCSGYIFKSNDAITIDFDFYSDETFNDVPSLSFQCPSATINGTVTFGTRVSINHGGAGPYVYKKGVKLTTPKTDYCMIRGNSNYPQIVFDDVFDGELFWHCATGYATYIFNVPGNKVGTFPKEMTYGRIVCGVENAFADTTQFEPGSNSHYIDLNGYNQRLTKFFGTAGKVQNTSATRAKFTHAYDGSSKVTASGQAIGHEFKGTIAGNLDYEFAPTIENYTYTFNGAKWTATGTVTVSNGTLVAKGVTFANAAGFVVRDGATLSLTSGSAVSSAASVTVEDGGTLALDDTIQLVTDGGTIRGKVLQRGKTYSAADTPGLSGAGTIAVRVVETEDEVVEWTGNGADTLTSTKENWNPSVKPALSSGGTVVTVVGGTAMTLDESVQFKALRFAGGANPFTVAGQSGDEEVTLLQKGVSTVEPAGAQGVQTNVIEAPLYVASEQVWDVGAGTMLDFRGGISSMGGISMLKGGVGELHLRGTNTNIGDFTITNGDVHVWCKQALGNPSVGKINYNRPNVVAEIRPRFFLHDGAAIERPLVMTLGKGNGASDDGEIVAMDGVSEVSGSITRQTGNLILEARKGATLIVSGGMTGNWFMPYGEGTIVLTNAPIFRLGGVGRATIAAYNGSKTYVYSSGNDAGGVELGNYKNLNKPIEIHLMTDNAFGESTCLRWTENRPNRILHLHGHDQVFGPFITCLTPNSGCCLTSDAPATVTFKQTQTYLADYNPNSTNAVPICGPITIVKKGDKLLCLNSNSPFWTGALEVREGTLELGKLKMPAVSEVSVTGGTLLVQPTAELGRKVDVSINGGKVDLADGVTMKCGWLYLDGKAEPEQPGTYGSSQSAAQFKDDEHFSGTGVLWARNGSGTLMLVR